MSKLINIINDNYTDVENIIDAMKEINSPYLLQNDSEELKKVDLLSTNSTYYGLTQFTDIYAYIGEQILYSLFPAWGMPYESTMPCYKFCIDGKNDNVVTKSDNTYRICTYNVHNWVSPCKLIKDGDNIKLDDTPTPKIYKNFKNAINVIKNINADVCCLQEIVPIYNNGTIDDLETFPTNNTEIEKGSLKPVDEYFKLFGYDGICMDTRLKKSENPYYYLGNAIYSKKKVGRINNVYNLGHDRICMSTIIDIFNHSVILLCVHLSYDKKERDKNFTKLFEILDNLKKINKLIIIAGDFNEDIFFGNNKSLFEKENFSVIPKIGMTTINNDNQVDHIIVSNEFLENFDVVNHDSVLSDASDHLPIYLDVIQKPMTGGYYLNKYKKYINKNKKYNIYI